MNEIVRAWMNKGCPYWEGVTIYEQMGSNEAVKKLLQLGCTDFFEKKLKAAMIEMLGKGEEAVNAQVEQTILKEPAIASETKPVKSYRKEDVYALPDDVAALVKLKGQTYKDAATLHATLLKSKKTEVRKKAAYEILRLMAINQNCWNKLNYYDKYGALPLEHEPPDYTTLNAGERELLIQRHRVYMSRHKWLMEPNAIEHPKYLYYSKEYARRKKELEELEKVS